MKTGQLGCSSLLMLLTFLCASVAHAQINILLPPGTCTETTDDCVVDCGGMNPCKIFISHRGYSAL